VCALIAPLSFRVSACGAYVDDDGATCAPGCSPSDQRADSFPVFGALLNALHRGIAVRLVSNDYGYPDCPGKPTLGLL
jgi:hypothetical protein